MMSRRDAGLPLPAAAALFSPWTDLAVTGASARENEASDPLFSRRMLKIAARAYLRGEVPRTRGPLRCTAICAVCRRYCFMPARTKCCVTIRRGSRRARTKAGVDATRAMARRAALLATGGGADAAGARVDRAGGGVFKGAGGRVTGLQSCKSNA